MENARLGNLFPVTIFVCVWNQFADLATGTQSASVSHTARQSFSNLHKKLHLQMRNKHLSSNPLYAASLTLTIQAWPAYTEF